MQRKLIFALVSLLRHVRRARSGKNCAVQNNDLTFLCGAHIYGHQTRGARSCPDVDADPWPRGLQNDRPNQSFEEFQKFGKQQFEALTAASTTVAKGLQEIATETTDYSKKAFAANSAVVEKLLGARDVETAIQIQTEFAKTAYEGFVAEATKIVELYAKLATEAFKPVETAYAKAPGK